MSPIEQLSDARRLPRDWKIRLGIRKTRIDGELRRAGKNETGFPVEQDAFVLDETSDEVKQHYGTQTKALRAMLPMDVEARHPATGDELVFNLSNRAYGRTRGLRCKGSGLSGDYPGMAITSDGTWAARISQATGLAEERLPGDRWSVRCLGQDCPKYLLMSEEPDPDKAGKVRMVRAPTKDPDASCKRVGILRFFVLTRTEDPQSPDYCKVLGAAEIATGSWNSIVDIQSGLSLLRQFTAGRTAGIPFTLIRKPTETFKPTRALHWTMGVKFNHAEIQRFAAIPLSEVFLSEEVRGQLRDLAARPLALTFDSVRDLVPAELAPDRNGGSEPEKAVSEPPAQPQGQGEASGGGEGEPDEGRLLVKSEREELKTLCGGREDPEGPADDAVNPFKRAAVERLRTLISAYDAEHSTKTERLSQLTVRHLNWIRSRIQEQPQAEIQEGLF